MATNQTPVEYCRHENCKREIRNCACNGDGTCGFNGVIHAKGNSHYCLPSPNCQVAEPADPPPMPHDKEYAEFADELRNYNFEPSLEVDKDQIRKLKAGTQMEETMNQSTGTYRCPFCGRDYPHTVLTHEYDAWVVAERARDPYKDWLFSLSEEDRELFLRNGGANAAGLSKRFEELTAQAVAAYNKRKVKWSDENSD